MHAAVPGQKRRIRRSSDVRRFFRGKGSECPGKLLPLPQTNPIYTMEFEGTVYKILPVTKGTSARGEWQRQDVVFEMNEGSFTRKICVTFFNKPEDVARLKEGSTYNVSVNIESRESTAAGTPTSAHGVCNPNRRPRRPRCPTCRPSPRSLPTPLRPHRSTTCRSKRTQPKNSGLR